jgi:hypothetical protein
MTMLDRWSSDELDPNFMITIDHRSDFLIDQSTQEITSRKSLKEQGMTDSEIDQEISSGQYTEVKI